MTDIKKTVVIIQRRLTHYRTPLFTLLKQKLYEHNISLRLLVGEPTKQELLKRDEGVISWAEKIPTYYFGALCWQPYGKYISNADLVITAQENKLIYNHFLLSYKKNYRIAFWGHGANLQSKNPNGLSERYKRWTSKRVDWWFAYTNTSLNLVSNTGFPQNKITNLENAIDTVSLLSNIEAITESEISKIRNQLGWIDGNIGIFIGSLYADKRLDFLLDSANKLKVLNPNFKLIILGSGPMSEMIKKFCQDKSWCIWVGAQTGLEKAKYLAVSDVLLNPGLVGLGILDSFVAKVPMVTTNCGLHSPEIAYLQQDQNGLMTANTIDAYVEGVQKVIHNTTYRNTLLKGCAESAKHYTIENMATNFLNGILRALAHQ